MKNKSQELARRLGQKALRNRAEWRSTMFLLANYAHHTCLKKLFLLRAMMDDVRMPNGGDTNRESLNFTDQKQRGRWRGPVRFQLYS